MILLKSSFRVSITYPDAVFLMNEYEVHRLPPEYSPLLDKLKVGIENAEDFTAEEVEQLTELHNRRVIYVVPTENLSLCNYLELSGWQSDYVNGQLANMSVEVIDAHPDPSWAVAITAALGKYGVLKSNPAIRLYISDRTTKFETIEYPALMVKVGSYRPTVGPFLSNQFPIESFNKLMLANKGGFETEAFQEVLPTYLHQLQLGLVIHEIMMFLIKLGNHGAANAIIEWDLVEMKRMIWKI